ncbi:MAG TPA: glycosyltransferase family 4 protein [Phycisphaerae bacterium]|nr:glycosyltransferase family 4 protein [Phycisphaerae bacterium]
MRVLHLLHSLRRGGLERVVVSVANGLSRRGIGQGVCCLHEAGPLIDCLDDDVRTFVLNARPNAAGLPLRLARVYRAFRPNVIHTVDFCSWPDATLAAVTRPWVRRMHTFHGFLSRPPRRYRLMGRALAALTHGLHAVSEELAATAANVYRLRPGRIAVLPNGVDVDFFDPALAGDARQKLGIPQHRFVCVTVASLTPAKNPLLLVEAARRVGPGVHFVWVGDGPLRAVMEEAVAGCDLDDVFTLAGRADDVRPWLAAADVFVLPSDAEAAPLCVLEAMAMQLPVVATRTGALEAIVGASRAGLLAERDDAPALADAIERLRAAPGHRRLMGVRGRNTVVERYGLDRMLDEYRRALERLCPRAAVPERVSPMPAGAG